MSVDLVLASSLEEFAPHAGAWDELAEREARLGLLAATLPWFASFVEHRLAEAGRSWGCLFAYEAERLVGVLPFVRKPHRALGGLKPWLHVPGDVHTTGGDVLLASGAGQAEVLSALLDAALDTRPHPVGLSLGGLMPDAPVLASTGPMLVAPEDLAGRSIALDGTWAEFHEALGPNLRRNLRKARNRLEREGTLGFERSTQAQDLERFLGLEAAGWKGADGGAVARNPEVLAFYRAFCARLAERGMAISWGNQIVLQRVAYDEAHARTSPGQVLLAAALEDWFAENRFARMDCLTDQPWHETWHMERTPYRSAIVAAPGIAGALLGRLPARARVGLKGIAPLRRLVRRLRGESPA